MNPNNTAEQIPARLFQDIPEGEKRQEMLDANSTKVEEQLVKVQYNEDQKDAMRKELVRDLGALQKHKEEFKKYKKEKEAEMTPLATNVEVLTKNIRTGHIEQEQDVYLYAYHEAGMMATYDRNGDLIETRRLRPEERQTSVIDMTRKTG